MAIKNLTLKQKFFILLGIILLSFIISGVINYARIMSIKQNWNSYQSHVTKRQTLLMEIKSNFGYGGIIHNFKNFVLRGKSKYADRFKEKHKAITDSIKEYSSLSDLTDKERQALLSIQGVADEYDGAIQLSQTIRNRGKSISEIDGAVKIDDSPAFRSFDSLASEYEVMTSQTTQKLVSSIKGAILTIIISSGVAFSFIILITLMISNNIIRTMQYLRDKMVAIEETGDLTGEIHISSNDESGQMAMAFNSMVKKISAIVLEIKRSSTQMDSASDNLSTTSKHISTGGGEQLERSSQVATASQQMSATVIEVAKNASGAAEAAKEANKAASHGGDIVKKTIDSMNGIAETTKVSSSVIASLGDRSNDIGNIIGVIDDIADQTNLLALNAAIEAARAGEQGRGFAVVADEVRKLAERTTKATKEIGGMIKAIQADTGKALSSMEAEVKVVEDGVSLACEAGSAIEMIIEQVDTVTSMIEQIATASDEQSTAADQISIDVETVANITREATEGTQQITSVSEKIAALAVDLQRAVAMFNVV